ncbi:D-alanyl-D-alanine carboxypeptidase/D-alanyl-D-alanine-endopeptidase (penicillin-binding protein 4) [Labedella gwakjiensis]|uniref:D-alanyl-D-alanine carboxypeptidase/D-alanyl-D-alanine-endopeptidase n=1 Tax=Labedella gwakjiensis TaxID=390269 RepID=A0A2P8GXK3_9MICO|nr:D-alanyl-D-alanine carboxypeptidase/D-alanyl-D-alanine-endopeptidase (penicillin-binding protein 4) [Labedella gwakjiensis]RUQ87926.1 D-alanyl-D-alanine carboxypeptidase/D-alanyl-D-alanine-endopeptidase [Labedella gwakjiensis]
MRSLVGVVLAAVLVGASVTSLGVVATTATAAPAVTATPTPTPTVDPRIVADDPVPATTPRMCSVADVAADPRLATLQAQVRSADTGEILFDRDGDTPNRTASTFKVITSAAALAVFGADHTFETRVVEGDEPGTIVLVGGGDITLTRLPTGQSSVYTDAAHLDDLAARTLMALTETGETDGTVTRIVVDASLFGTDDWRPDWNPNSPAEGYQTRVTALQVDGDRDDPTRTGSPRGTDPVGRAADAFASYFPGAVVESGTASADAEELAVVSSPTVASLVHDSLLESDNMIAEALARLVSIELGAGNTFAALQQAIPEALADYGIPTDGIVVADGSGLSTENAVPPSYLTRLFGLVEDGAGDLEAVEAGLPVAGETGTLDEDERFTGDSAAARGHVFAKTGYIRSAYTLSGIIEAADGSTLVFTIYALGTVGETLPTTTMEGIDALTTAFYRCGSSLSNG